MLISLLDTSKIYILAYIALINAFTRKVIVVAIVINYAYNVITKLIKRVFYEHYANFLFCRYGALSLALKVRANPGRSAKNMRALE